MRLFAAALLGLLSLAVAGCAQEAVTTEQQLEAQVDVGDADTTEPQVAPTEAVPSEAAPTEVPPAEPTKAPTEEPEEAAPQGEQDAQGDGLFPTVVGATASTSDGVGWNVSVTLSSEYDSRDRYADAWRVLDADDNELGIRVLGHDHANEQPFTRSTSVDIPTDIAVVYIEGRDQVNGWSGERFELMLRR